MLKMLRRERVGMCVWVWAGFLDTLQQWHQRDAKTILHMLSTTIEQTINWINRFAVHWENQWVEYIYALEKKVQMSFLFSQNEKITPLFKYLAS